MSYRLFYIDTPIEHFRDGSIADGQILIDGISALLPTRTIGVEARSGRTRLIQLLGVLFNRPANYFRCQGESRPACRQLRSATFDRGETGGANLPSAPILFRETGGNWILLWRGLRATEYAALKILWFKLALVGLGVASAVLKHAR